jgi:hypothetical protein
MAVDHHIGFEIAERSLRLVELRVSDGFPSILRADEVATSHAFGSSLLHSIPFDRDLAKAFVRDVAALVHRRPFLAQRISIVLPPLVPLIGTFPVDAHLPPDEQRRHLERECRRLTFIDDASDVSVLSFPIERAEAADTHLAVSLPRTTVDFLQSVFSHLTFQVDSIDIEHFVVERASQRIYKEVEGLTCGTLGLFTAGCTASIARADTYFGFRVAAASWRRQYLAHALSLLTSLLQTRARASLEALVLFGDERCEEFHPSLEQALGIPVHRFLPSRNISFMADTAALDADRLPPHVFTAATAAAWNGLA